MKPEGVIGKLGTTERCLGIFETTVIRLTTLCIGLLLLGNYEMKAS